MFKMKGFKKMKCDYYLHRHYRHCTKCGKQMHVDNRMAKMTNVYVFCSRDCFEEWKQLAHSDCPDCKAESTKAWDSGRGPRKE